MENAEDPETAYARALTVEQNWLASLRRGLRVMVWVRILDLLAFVGLAGQSCSQHGGLSSGAWISALAFIGLSVLIAWLESRVSQGEARAQYFHAGQARVRGDKPETGDEGQRFLDPTHPYAADLDIFGPSSLYAHLCAARTGAARRPWRDGSRRARRSRTSENAKARWPSSPPCCRCDGICGWPAECSKSRCARMLWKHGFQHQPRW